MQITLFQIVQAVVLFILFIYLAYYVYTVLFDKGYQPKWWKHELKNGNIDPRLIKLEKNYPDKVRFFNFWLQVERLKKDHVDGAFAELGVYQGDSAFLLHKMDPGRRFHLFDTFEGFDPKDLKMEEGKAATYTSAHFADTSLEKVKKKLNHPNFIFHKGYFPETAKGVRDEKFALVNMDADLYLPTKTGLEFFYPRLSRGGVIIIHDYTPDWPGILKAVNDYCEQNHLIKVLLPDVDGTVMLFKGLD
jgi:O-methyltransferase